jgi:hypothetical protein
MSVHAPRDLEAFMARLYVDEAARARFVRDPEHEARSFGLTDVEARALQSLDLDQLALAAHSFTHKRRHARRRGSWLEKLSAVWTWLRA